MSLLYFNLIYFIDFFLCPFARAGGWRVAFSQSPALASEADLLRSQSPPETKHLTSCGVRPAYYQALSSYYRVFSLAVIDHHLCSWPLFSARCQQSWRIVTDQASHSSRFLASAGCSGSDYIPFLRR